MEPREGPRGGGRAGIADELPGEGRVPGEDVQGAQGVLRDVQRFGQGGDGHVLRQQQAEQLPLRDGRRGRGGARCRGRRGGGGLVDLPGEVVQVNPARDAGDVAPVAVLEPHPGIPLAVCLRLRDAVVRHPEGIGGESGAEPGPGRPGVGVEHGAIAGARLHPAQKGQGDLGQRFVRQAAGAAHVHGEQTVRHPVTDDRQEEVRLRLGLGHRGGGQEVVEAHGQPRRLRARPVGLEAGIHDRAALRGSQHGDLHAAGADLMPVHLPLPGADVKAVDDRHRGGRQALRSQRPRRQAHQQAHGQAGQQQRQQTPFPHEQHAPFSLSRSGRESLSGSICGPG